MKLTNLPKDKKLVSIRQATAVLGVSIDTVRRWDKSGVLHSTRPDGKTRYFSIDELEKVKFNKPMTIGEASKHLGISASTLRRLENKGLLRPERSSNGERLYTKDSVQKFLDSDYFMRKSEVQEKILEPEINPSRQTTTQKIREVEIQEVRSRMNGLLLIKKALFVGAGSFAVLVLIIAALLYMFPEETGYFLDYKRTPPVQASQKSLQVLAASTESSVKPASTRVISTLVRPISNVSLNIVKAVSPERYERAVEPTPEFEDFFVQNIDGSITPTARINIVDIDGILVAGKNIGLIQSADAVTVQGREPGTQNGDLAIVGLIPQPESFVIADESITSAQIKNGTITVNDLAFTIPSGSSSSSSNSGDITAVTLGDGLLGGGDEGDVTVDLNLATNSGLEINGGGELSLVTSCSDGEILKWNDTSNIWECGVDNGGGGGGGVATVQESDSTVDGTVTVLDFLGGDFDLTESPEDEINVALAQVLTSVIGVAGDFEVGGTLIFDSLDSVSESTIESAIDTLANLASITIGGDTITEFVGTGLGLSGNTLTTILGSSISNSEIDNDAINLDKVAASLTLDEETTISAGGALNLLIGNNVTFSSTGTGSIIANDLNCTNCIGATEIADIALGTDTSGNYVAAISGNTQIGVSGSGSENASVSLSLNSDSVTLGEIADSLTFDANFTLATSDSTNDYKLILDNSSTGDIAELLEFTTSGSGATVGVAVDLADDDISTALALGSNDITVGGATISAAEFAILDGEIDISDDTNLSATGGVSLTGDQLTATLGTSISDSEIDDDTIDFDKIADALTLDTQTDITAGSATSLRIGNNATLTTTGSGTIIATDLSCSDCIGATEISVLTLGTDTNGDYVASFTAGNGLTGSGSGEGSTPTIAISPQTGGGLSVSGSGLTMLRTCDTDQILKWTGTAWACGDDEAGGGSDLTVSESGSAVDATVSVLDFLGGDFDLSESPEDEINISLASSLTSVTTLPNLTSLTIGGDTITDFVGTGLVLSGNTLTTTLGVAIDTSEITDGTITGDDISSSVVGNGLVLSSGSPDVLDIDESFDFTFTGNVGIAPAGSDVLTITLDADTYAALNQSVGSTNSSNGLVYTLTNSSSAGTQNGLYLDNAASTGTTESLLVIDNSDADTAITNGIQFISAGGGFTNLFNVAGTAISSSEFTLLDSGVTYTELTDSGTLVVTTADINGGNIDGVTIGGTSAGAGTFTTLTANTSVTMAGDTIDEFVGTGLQVSSGDLQAVLGASIANSEIDNDTINLDKIASSLTLDEETTLSAGGALNFLVGNNVTLTTTGTGAIVATDFAGDIALGTDTSGNYVAGATANAGLTLTGTEGGTLGINVQADKGLEVDSNGLSLIDCSEGEVLKYVSDEWVCEDDNAGVGSIGLDDAYNEGQTITVDEADILFDLSDATNDYGLVIDNNTAGAIAVGLEFTSGGGGALTTAIDASANEIATAIAIGSNDVTVGGATISSTEFARLDGKDAALVDTNDAVSTAVTGTGTLTSGATGAGFTINFGTSTLSGNVTGANISGVDISDDTNLTATSGIDLTGDQLTATLGTSIANGEIDADTITLASVADSLTLDAANLIFASSDSTNDYKVVIDNSSTGAIANLIEVTTSGSGSSIALALDLDDADIDTAISLGGNDITVGGATISSSEFALLDSGVALSELTDSGTLTATTVDINGGAIDGVTIGGSSAGAGTFTTLTVNTSITIAGDTIDEFVGTGLQISSGDLQTTLGTSIANSELDNDTINLDKVSASLTLDEETTLSASGGLNFLVGNNVTLTTTGTGALVATDLTCTNCIGATEIADLALGTDTSGNYVAGATSNAGLTMTGTEGGTLGVNVQADKGLEVDSSGLSLIDCSEGEVLKYISDEWVCEDDNAGVGSIGLDDAYNEGQTITVDEADILFDLNDATNDYGLVIDNNTASAIAIGLEFTSGGGGALTTAIDVSANEIGTAIAVGSNDVTVGGATISSSEFAILDSGVALSELTDSGTLTAGTVDINGGAIDGVTIGGSSAGVGTFTTLTATGAIAANGDSITSDGATLTINAGGAVDVQDGLTADSLTLDTGNLVVSTGTIDGALTLASTTSDNLLQITLTNTTSSGTQNVAYFDNAANSGATESLLVLDNSDNDTAVTNGIQFVDAGGGFTNLFNVAGTAISTGEFTLLDSGVALSELTDSGTLTATTVDINGGAIDGTTIGANSAAAATITTLTLNTSITMASDTIDEFVGTGLQVSSGDLQTTLGVSIANSELDNDTINLDKVSASLTLDEETTITAGGALNFLIGNNATLTTTGSGAIIASDLTCTNCINATEISDLTLGTDTAGNYVAGATTDAGLTMTGTEGGTLGINIQASKGLEVDSNGLSLIDCSDGEILKYASNAWDCDDDDSGAGGGSLDDAYNEGATITVDAADILFDLNDATNDYGLVIDNNTASAIAIGLEFTSGGGGDLTTAIDVSTGAIVTAIAIGSNDVTVGGATISSSEFALIDSGIALSELTDSGTLTAGTVDINGGAIDGTAIGASSASTGAFTTLASTGATTIGNNSATVAINSNDWDIDATGAITGVSFNANGSGNSISNLDNADLTDDTIDWDKIIDSSSLDADTSIAAGTGEDLTFAKTFTNNTSENGFIANFTASDTGSSTTAQYGMYLDNLASTEGVDALLVLDNSDSDDAVGAAIKTIDAGGTFTNLFDIAGTLISTGEFTLLDSGVALSELTDSGTFTATTVDINGGAIDGTVIGGSSAAAGTFTTVGASGAIAANGGITFNDATDTLGAFTAAGTIDTNSNIVVNIGSTGTDFTTSGALAVTLDSTEAEGALSVDNGANASSIFVAEDNGTDVFTIADGGTVTATQNINANGGFDVDDVFVIADGGAVTANTDVTYTLAEAEDVALNWSVSGTQAGQGQIVTVTNSSSSGNQYGMYLDNAASTGTTEALLVVDNSDTNTAVSAGIQFVNAGGNFTIGIDMANSIIANIGAAGTDFSGTGGLTLADALGVTSGGITVTAGAVAVNSDSITSDGTLTIDANGSVVLGGSGNTFTFSETTGPAYAGTARPAKTVTLVPEFEGAVLTGDGSNNSGTMTTDFCSEDGRRNVNTAGTPTNASPCDNDVSGEEHNYYTWTSTSATQDYDIWVRWQVPSDFSGFAASNAVQAYGWRTDGTNAVTISMYDTGGTIDNAGGTNVATGTVAWTQTTVESAPGGTYTQGSYVTFRINMANDTANDHVKIGEITINYLGRF